MGTACAAVVRAIFGDKLLIRKLPVQGVLGLQKKYGPVRLEAACSRANHYRTPDLNVVKRILKKGADQQDLLAAFNALAGTYSQGGCFYGATNAILQLDRPCIQFKN